VAAVAALQGRKPPGWFRTLPAGCLATVVAVVIKDRLQSAFGRLRPESRTRHNPSWIGTGTCGLSPFHGKIRRTCSPGFTFSGPPG